MNIVSVATVMSALGFLKKCKFDDEYGKLGDVNIKKEDKEKLMNLLRSAQLVYCDETQHYAAETCQKATLSCSNAFYRFSGSATPERSDNAELIIQGLFGRYLCDIGASDLIKMNFLMKPIIMFSDMDHEINPAGRGYMNEYDIFCVNNLKRNNIIRDIALRCSSKNYSTLILVSRIKHGEILERIIPESVFIKGEDSSTIRQEMIENLSKKHIKILIATTIADEGLDIPQLDALILAGSGKQAGQTYQRIGRVIRKHICDECLGTGEIENVLWANVS